jgi:hypothetical protein
VALRTSSRYTYQASSSDEKLVAVRKKSAPSSAYSKYVSREGDSFEMIASKIFNDPTQYWRVADINPQVKFPDIIPAGTVIRLPA